MEKVIAAILSGVMVLSMAACSSSSSSGSESSSSKKSSAKIVSNSKETEDNNEKKSSKDATIEETVLVDESGIKITATKLSYDGISDPELGLLIENNYGKDVTLQCESASVNGYMVETTMSVDVLNGKKANDRIELFAPDLELSGITAIADIELSFRVFDLDTGEHYFITSPAQIKTSIGDTYSYPFDDSGELLYKDDDFKIVSKGVDWEDPIFGTSILVYIENNSSQNITVQARNVAVNGFMIDPTFSSEIAPGKRIVDRIKFEEWDIEENKILKIENADLSFCIFETYGSNTIIDTDMITLNF